MFNYQGYSTIAIKSFIKDRIILSFLLSGLIFNVFTWSIMGWGIRFFPESIPLHYNIYFGPDLFGPWYQILFIPGLGLSILITDFLLGLYFFKNNSLLTYFLMGIAAVVQILLFIASIFIIYLNY